MARTNLPRIQTQFTLENRCGYFVSLWSRRVEGSKTGSSSFSSICFRNSGFSSSRQTKNARQDASTDERKDKRTAGFSSLTLTALEREPRVLGRKEFFWSSIRRNLQGSSLRLFDLKALATLLASIEKSFALFPQSRIRRSSDLRFSTIQPSSIRKTKPFFPGATKSPKQPRSLTKGTQPQLIASRTANPKVSPF